MIELTLNGKEHQTTADTVAVLIEQLALTQKRVAVERNGEIVSRSQHGNTPLVSGDRIEIVQAIGGG